MLPKAKTFVAKAGLARGSANNGVFKVKLIALRSALSASLVAVALILAAPNAEATPKFARQTGQNCSFCHSGVPRLNDTGLSFKNNGFRLPNSNETSGKDHKEAPAQ
jgi:hypothetical protein